MFVVAVVVCLIGAACSQETSVQAPPTEIRVATARVWVGADWFPAPAPVLANPTAAWSRPVRFGQDGDVGRAADFVVFADRLDPDRPDGDVHLVRVDPTTGDEIWSLVVAGPGTVNVGLLPLQNTVILSLVDGSAVAQYVVDLDDGQTLWFSDGSDGRFNARFIEDFVVLDSTDGTSYVIDRSSGADLWQTSADVRLVINSGRVFFLDMPEQRVGVRDPRTGAEVWSAAMNGRPASPTFANGLVMVSAAPNSGDDELAAFDLQTGVEKWRVREPKIGNGLKIPFRDVLVISDLGIPSSTLFGVSIATGEVMWTRKTNRQAASVAGIEIDGRGFLIAPDGEVEAVIDVATGETLANSTGEREQSAVSAGAVYQSGGGDGSIVALRLADLEPLWTLAPAEGSRRSSVFGAAGAAVLVIDDVEDVGFVLTAYVEGNPGPE